MRLMGDFFQGWRRKAGVATLALAIPLMLCWARSRSTVDLVYLNVGRSNCAIISGGNGFLWTLGRRYEILQRARRDGIWITLLDDNRFITGSHLIETKSWAASRLDVARSFSEALRDEGIQTPIPYWVIVWPLILLSSGLLLITPRSVMPIKHDNDHSILEVVELETTDDHSPHLVVARRKRG